MVDEWDKVALVFSHQPQIDGSVHSPLPRSLCVRDSTHDIHQTSAFEFSFANIYQVLDDPRAYVQRLEMDMLNQDHHRHRVSEASDDPQARPVDPLLNTSESVVLHRVFCPQAHNNGFKKKKKDPLLALFKHERQTIDRPSNKARKRPDYSQRCLKPTAERVMCEVHRTLASSSRNASVSRKRRRCMACGEGGEFGGEKSGVHDVNESTTIAAVELGRGVGVTRAFLGETIGMHRGQCPHLDILKYDEASLLRKIIKIETSDHPRPKATVESIRRKVHSHFPVLLDEMYPANWVICVLRKAWRSTHRFRMCRVCRPGPSTRTSTRQSQINNIASTLNDRGPTASSTKVTKIVLLAEGELVLVPIHMLDAHSLYMTRNDRDADTNHQGVYD
ncbi:hypothetical protein EDB85DRAFT_2227969 [Lactarius pseudohatsudake]|nr:hypothetical protein EDB85DRAFT_2227969 [Lactarius pseudohatsudake]